MHVLTKFVTSVVRHRWEKSRAPVRLQHGIRQQEVADDRITAPHRDSKPFPRSPNDTDMALPPHGVRLTTRSLP
jgi:hypothetical protein